MTINTTTQLDIRFETQDRDIGGSFILDNKVRPLTKRSDVTDEFGFSIYNIDLTAN